MPTLAPAFASFTMAPACVQFLEAMQEVPHFAGLKFTDTNFYLFQQIMHLGKGTGGGRPPQLGRLPGPVGLICLTMDCRPAERGHRAR